MTACILQIFSACLATSALLRGALTFTMLLQPKTQQSFRALLQQLKSQDKNKLTILLLGAQLHSSCAVLHATAKVAVHAARP